MGSTSPPPSSATFPTIDISPFLNKDSPPHTLQKTATQLSTACATPGFFYLTNHNLPPALTDRVLALARDFFLHTSDAEKESLKRRNVGDGNGDGARGYQLIGDNVTEGKRDFHEALDWYRPVDDDDDDDAASQLSTKEQPTDGDEKLRDELQDDARERHRQPPYELLQGVNAWPTHPEGFREVYEEYVSGMLELGTAVVRAMGMALGGGMEEVFVGNTRRSWWVMRAIGYPPLPSSSSSSSSSAPASTSASADRGGGRRGEGVEGDGSSISCGAHTDYGCVTLLLADQTKGALQAWLGGGDGGEGGWVDVEPRDGALVVNVGDMMERWSQGKWKATRHRVVHRGQGFRVSVPFFFEPDWEARVPGKEGEGDVVYGRYLEGKVRGNF
ncbi:hypothetical protein MMC28_000352 [Mycoblastus sanguinarius]|nr:hypothetical protein [Mycoblastus sanguinarius]